ncbi:hypothetical protein DBV15_10290 [Temnothorax longispinosus]|uniref:Peptidase A1 domain-containing protein n=1 Tax=Temnothorax longispinosus TaxID=300112 RepID=A0A4S2J9S8_9HYME|nr:hypothetical protein DBV15_10290 [Temnothorax longispinosus]
MKIPLYRTYTVGKSSTDNNMIQLRLATVTLTNYNKNVQYYMVLSKLELHRRCLEYFSTLVPQISRCHPQTASCLANLLAVKFRYTGHPLLKNLRRRLRRDTGVHRECRGWIFSTTVLSQLEPQRRSLKYLSILVHQISGYHPKTATLATLLAVMKHKKFDRTKSTTYVRERTRFNISYHNEKWQEVKLYGQISIDNIMIGPLWVTSQIFGEVLKFPTQFWDQLQCDGVLGIGYSESSLLGTRSVFANMIRQHVVSQPIISIYLNRKYENSPDGGLLILGQPNHAHYVGEFTYVDVSRKKY